MKRLLFVLLTLICKNTFAQQEFPLYNGPVPNSKGCAVKEVWTKAEGGRGNVKGVTIPTLKVYEPQKGTNPRPAIIICPGGGYNNLSIYDGGYETAVQLSKAGVVAFVLKYRLSDSLCNTNNGIVALQDAQKAIYTIRKQAAKWNIDPQKIGYLGFSAGGHLSAMAATQFIKPQIDAQDVAIRPDFVILAYPVISFTDSLTSKKSKSRSNLLGNRVSTAQIRFFSPELNVTPNTPPAFLIHASDDSTSLVENSMVYYRALHRNKVQATLKIYQTGGHGFANYNKAEDDHWIPSALNWMRLNHFLD